MRPLFWFGYAAAIGVAWLWLGPEVAASFAAGIAVAEGLVAFTTSAEEVLRNRPKDNDS